MKLKKNYIPDVDAAVDSLYCARIAEKKEARMIKRNILYFLIINITEKEGRR